jgi:hypothetical protein
VSTKRIIKIAFLNISIAIINVAIFSKGLINIQLSGSSSIRCAFGYTVIMMSILIFIYGNYKLLIAKVKAAPAMGIKSIEYCIDSLKEICDKETFEKDIDTILGQLKRLGRKKDTINDIILQKFSETELSYAKFNSAIEGIEDLLLTSIKSTINKINAFDQEEYNSITESKSKLQISNKLMQTKLDIYQEYISYVQASIENNEEILVKLDMFLLELSKLNSIENKDILSMAEFQELEEIINKTKLYK